MIEVLFWVWVGSTVIALTAFGVARRTEPPGLLPMEVGDWLPLVVCSLVPLVQWLACYGMLFHIIDNLRFRELITRGDDRW